MKSPNRIRRTVRILGLAAAVLILCLMLTAVVLMAALDDDDYRRLAEWSVEQFTGCRMIVEGPFTVDWSAELALSAAGIRFESTADGPQPSLTSIGQFHVKVALKPLLLGRIVVKKLAVDDVLVSIDDPGAGEDASPQRRKPPPDIIIPIFESVVLQNIRVAVVEPDRDRKVNVLLRQLTMDDIKDTGPLFVKAEGAVNANDFQIDGRLGALADILKKSNRIRLSSS